MKQMKENEFLNLIIILFKVFIKYELIFFMLCMHCQIIFITKNITFTPHPFSHHCNVKKNKKTFVFIHL